MSLIRPPAAIAPRTTSSRRTFFPRVTVATVVEHEGRFLFVEEVIKGQTVLNQPAGHLDPGESLAEAAVRETLEETAWTVELTGLIGIYQYDAPDDRHFVRTTFAARALGHDPRRRLDRGIVRALWLSRDELLGHPTPRRSPMVLRCLDDYSAGQQLPLAAAVRVRE